MSVLRACGGALTRVLTSIGTLVIDEMVVVLTRSLLTRGVLVWLLLLCGGVDFLVVVRERLLVFERFPARAALMRLFDRVRLLVLLQLAESREGLLTQRALVALLSGVGPLVSLQVTQSCKGFVACTALIRFFACMDSLVLLEMMHTAVGLATSITHVRLFSCVGPQVEVQITFQHKSFSACATLMWFFTTVDFLMCLEVADARKGLFARGARKGAFASVGALVSVQVALSRERLPADEACKRLVPCVDSHVHLESTDVSKRLFAHAALVWLWSRVELLVPLQVHVGGETVSASGTEKWSVIGVHLQVVLRQVVFPREGLTT